MMYLKIIKIVILKGDFHIKSTYLRFFGYKYFKINYHRSLSYDDDNIYMIDYDYIGVTKKYYSIHVQYERNHGD
jgi:hypothetical protein